MNPFHQDPRLKEAKKLVLETLQDHQKNITGIRPPLAEEKNGYATLISEFNAVRGGSLFYPYLGSGFGKGPFVELLDGSIKYDFIIGIGVHYAGHSHPKIVESALDAAFSDIVMQGNLQQNSDSVAFSKLLLKTSKMDHCFLTSTGVMANENGLKLLFQKKHPASRLLAFEHCFMGRTLALSQVTDKPLYRKGLPSHIFVDYIPFFNEEKPEESTQEAVLQLKKLLKRYPKQYAAMSFELVQGEGGFYTAPASFFKALMTILKEENVGILVDEVQSFGRLPALYATHYYDLEEYVDIITIGKLSQACATLFRKDLLPEPGLLSQTFTASTSAIHAGHFIIQELVEGGYHGPHGKITKLHEMFKERFIQIEKKAPHLIQGPYGIGAMIAFTPWGGKHEDVVAFAKRLFENGVITFLAGENPTRIRLLIPSLALEPHHVNEALAIIEKTLLERL